MAVEIRDGVKYFDVTDISESMKVTAYSVRRWIREGRLRARKVGRKYYVSGEALRQYIESGAPSPSPPKVHARA